MYIIKLNKIFYFIYRSARDCTYYNYFMFLVKVHFFNTVKISGVYVIGRVWTLLLISICMVYVCILSILTQIGRLIASGACEFTLDGCQESLPIEIH